MLQFLALLCLSQQAFGLVNVVVSTEGGDVEGHVVHHKLGYKDTPTSTLEFLGIPYATPPIGDLRWNSPQPHKGWDQVLNASQFGPACPQEHRPGSIIKAEYQSEDCLTLNIWVPQGQQGKPLPVMVFLYGGGYVGGGSDAPKDLYRGYAFAEEEVILVTLNYRLGPLGFLYHPLFSNASTRGTSGNTGAEDQRMALQWVQRNIRNFGGNPDDVTLFGESAGSFLTCFHLMSPHSAGLFKRVILQSGPCTLASWHMEGAEEQANTLIETLGCQDSDNVLGCLRAKPVEEVIAAATTKVILIFDEGFAWTTTIDFVDLHDHPFKLLKEGKMNPVEQVLLGANMDEGTLWSIGRFPLTLSNSLYQSMLKGLFNDRSSEVEAVYATPDTRLQSVFGEVIDDFLFCCGTSFMARKTVELQIPTYVYEFRFYSPADTRMRLIGVFHGSELAYVFHAQEAGFLIYPDQIALSQRIVKYWTQFAKTGNPNPSGAEEWKPYTLSEPVHIVLDEKPVHHDIHNQTRCTLMESLFEPNGTHFQTLSTKEETLIDTALNVYALKALRYSSSYPMISAPVVLLFIYGLLSCCRRQKHTPKPKEKSL